MMRVGLAMLQGARHEHEEAILSIAKDLLHDVEVVQLRRGDQLDASIHGLISVSYTHLTLPTKRIV